LNRPKLALYATVYPAVRRFLPAWYRSVQDQVDDGFDLWLGVDAMTKADVVACLGTEPTAHWVVAEHGDTGTSVRLRAMQRIVDRYDAVVFVDSDDLLSPTRIAEDRKQLQRHDVVGCALRVVDESGADTGVIFGPAPEARPDEDLARYNVFGLSNSAYRSDVLRRCLPFPSECVLVDWFLATRAWLGGADLWFDATPRMRYRQYGLNIARIIPPFTAQEVSNATQRVLGHYDLVLPLAHGTNPAHTEAMRAAQREVATFASAVRDAPAKLAAYTRALNCLPTRYVWWWAVANPQLRHLWS